MNKNEYGEVINGEKTYKFIAKKLLNNEAVLIGWEDEDSTHFDILFKLGAYKENGNMIQRGIKGSDLFASIMSYSSFGFKTDDKKYQSYIEEKLNLGNNITTKKITELINGIIENL